MNEVKAKYRCPKCGIGHGKYPCHCSMCGYVEHVKRVLDPEFDWAIWECGHCNADVSNFYEGSTTPIEYQPSAKDVADYTPDIFRPLPVDSGAWICWLLIGMLMGLLAGGVLAVWYLK